MKRGLEKKILLSDVLGVRPRKREKQKEIKLIQPEDIFIKESREEMIEFMEKLAIKYPFEIGGNYVPLEGGKYEIEYHIGDKHGIYVSKNRYGIWHSHPPEINLHIFDLEEGLIYSSSIPSTRDLISFILSDKVKESIIIGPTYTIELEKKFEDYKEVPFLVYMIGEIAHSLLKEWIYQRDVLGVTSRKNENNEDPFDIGITSKTVDQMDVAIYEFLEEHGEEIGLNKNYREAWVDLANLLGIEVRISKNKLIERFKEAIFAEDSSKLEKLVKNMGSDWRIDKWLLNIVIEEEFMKKKEGVYPARLEEGKKIYEQIHEKLKILEEGPNRIGEFLRSEIQGEFLRSEIPKERDLELIFRYWRDYYPKRSSISSQGAKLLLPIPLNKRRVKDS